MDILHVKLTIINDDEKYKKKVLIKKIRWFRIEEKNIVININGKEYLIKNSREFRKLNFFRCSEADSYCKQCRMFCNFCTNTYINLNHVHMIDITQNGATFHMYDSKIWIRIQKITLKFIEPIYYKFIKPECICD